MKFKKKILAFAIGSLVGIISALIYIKLLWLPSRSSEIGLGIVGLFPVALVMFVFLGIVMGGFLGIIIYQVFLKKYFK